MKREVALKIIERNKDLYNQIAQDFSDSRVNLWPEFEYFTGYLKNNQDILDLGCGNGRVLDLLKDFQINYLGVDNSSKLIAQAQQNWPQAKFMVADILDLKDIKQKYDIIFLVATLHHIPSAKLREQVLSNIKQLLKPDGKLLMTNWNLWQKRYIKYIIKYTLLKLTEPNMEINGVKARHLDLQDVFIPWKKKYMRYLHGFTELNMSRLVKKCGFEIIKNVSNTRNIITVCRNKN